MIKAYLKESIATQTLMLNDDDFINILDKITKVVVDTLKNGNKL